MRLGSMWTDYSITTSGSDFHKADDTAMSSALAAARRLNGRP